MDWGEVIREALIVSGVFIPCAILSGLLIAVLIYAILLQMPLLGAVSIILNVPLFYKCKKIYDNQ